MKKLYEGVSVATAVIFVLYVGIGFFLKKEAFLSRSKAEKKAERKIVEVEKKKDSCHDFDHQKVKAWEEHYQNMCNYQKERGEFDHSYHSMNPPPTGKK